MVNLEFCKYDKKNDIHFIDYSGEIDLQKGISRIEKLEKYFRTHEKPGEQFKVLLDTRCYQKHSPETHDKLAKIARDIFNKSFQVKLAVLDVNYEYQLSDKEAWFTDMLSAINWLKSPTV